MKAYPRYFLPLLWTGLSVLVISGLLLAPGIFELRLQWEVPWSLPGGSRTLVAALHGLCAMMILVVIGALLPLHVQSGLKAARNFVTGIILLTALATLALTGWAIYYVVNEDLSAFASLLHLGAGVACLLPLAIHAIHGIKLRRAQGQHLRFEVTAFRNQPRAGKRVA